MSSFIVHLVVQAAALAITARLVSGMSIDSWGALGFAALVVSVINAFVRPILTILTFPITLLTLGLFYFVVNGLCLWLASKLAPGFHLQSFWSAVVAAFVAGLVSWALHVAVKRTAPGGKR
jgi:putative membrane protein